MLGGGYESLGVVHLLDVSVPFEGAVQRAEQLRGELGIFYLERARTSAPAVGLAGVRFESVTFEPLTGRPRQ